MGQEQSRQQLINPLNFGGWEFHLHQRDHDQRHIISYAEIVGAFGTYAAAAGLLGEQIVKQNAIAYLQAIKNLK